MVGVIVFLVFQSILISAYNIHEKPTLMEQDSTPSFFGYSVVLHAQKNPPKSWLLVGAPKSKLASVQEPGLVYRYDLQLGTYHAIRPSELNDESGFISSVTHNLIIRKAHGWFGAVMAVQPDNDELSVCAPRTMITLYNVVTRFHSMHGVCYVGNVTSDRLKLEDRNLESHDFTATYWYNPLHGFSAHYPASSSTGNNKMISGSPKQELVGSVRIKGKKKAVFFPKIDDLTMLGYSVSSGRFFDKNQLLYVGGAPGWNLIGRVGIIDPNSDAGEVISTIDGTTVGEYFGASLTSCDLNNDGLDEVIIGAPHWGQDQGRVYVHFGNSKGTFEDAEAILNGNKEGGQFGYSLTCGDLDGDGFDDLIVGAPWENNGVVYIYNGDSSFQSKFQSDSQRLSVTSPVTTFGFSLSKPVDIDNNGFPDLAIGAYKSNCVTVLSSRPVIKSHFRVMTYPSSLSRNSTNFVIGVCVNQTKKGEPVGHSFNLTLNIDEGLNRVQQSQTTLQHISSWKDTESTVCLNTTVDLMKIIRNYIDPITIKVTHSYGTATISKDKGVVECNLCPIEYKQASKTQEIDLPFDIGCGDDEICTASLSLSGRFYNTKNGTILRNNTWIIGSNDISLELNISNHKEPAYLTVFTLILPENTNIRSILPSCRENEEDNVVKIVCDVDNPLLSGSPKTLVFDLDMHKINNGSHDNTNLNFLTTVTTRSRQLGDSSVTFPLILKTNVSLLLEGLAKDRSYEILSTEEIPQNVTFEQTYQVTKFGATPVITTRLTVNVPYGTEDEDIFVLTREPKILVRGKYIQCSIQNITILNQKEAPQIMDMDNKNTFDLDTKPNHILLRREVNQTNYDVEKMEESISNDSAVFSSLKNSGHKLITLSCSSPSVKCGQIICDINTLNTERDTARLRLQFTVNSSKLMGEDKLKDSDQITEFITDAWVDVVHPALNWTISGTSNVTTTMTSFIKMKTTRQLLEQVNIWIFVGSILLGLLALFLIAIGLRAMGFFKRATIEEIEEAIAKDDATKDSHRLSDVTL